MERKFEYSVKSVCGLVRGNNEDNFYVDGQYKPLEEPEMELSGETGGETQLFVVCDGMGGEDAGEVASYETVIHAEEYWKGDPTEFVRELNRAVLAKSIEIGYVRMGCTITFLGQNEDKLIVGNVGDSRSYRFHNGELFRTSKDHSKAQMLVDMGIMDEDEARESDAWHILMQNLGLEEEEALLVPYIEEFDFEEDDCYLLCSDGLSDLISEDVILEVMMRDASIQEKVEELTKLALEAGGRDNTTVMIVKCIA